MKIVCGLLLILVSAFVVASVADACPETEGSQCPPACHWACADGCTVAPVEAPPPPVGLELATYLRLQTAFTPRDLDFPPEVFPPKA